MKSDVVVPEVGESVSSGVLASWLKTEGETVSEGDELFELETDKATLAVPSPADGVLSIKVSEDTEVEVGQTVGIVDSEGAAAGTTDADSAVAAADAPAAAGADTDTGSSEHDIDVLSPAVRRVVTENNLDPSRISGSGKGGRILKEDALKSVEAQKAAGVDGGVAADDAGAAGREAAPAKPAPERKPQPAVPSGERRRRVKMSTLRKRIAENMVASKQNAAHLTTFNEVDMSPVSSLRKTYRDEFEQKYEVKLGFMSFFVKAACAALAEFPEVNAFVDGEEIVYNDYYNIGVALSSERGLIVPVLRDADAKSFAEIEQQILDFIQRAQNRKIMPDELAGGTFTISNGGVFGSMLSTPIPNPPQTAVLGMHSIQQRPVAVDGEVVIRPMMYLALTYDHRIIDGREAVLFLGKIKGLIEDPRKMLLDI
ncbi:MAG: 2-oxoglutarate dehydrogenase complex dihydrolipoyllysine-residue succinyltransferase [Spirochaetes bacterium]|jgi:2-oxoglutarate dehydrogenase E2 component (dihydrolipoamide succinyltransferase)|nr:2-oxoglutarate dehydrogenase complex dihydrolipoyllysine-residue succinyltransferase [Spirochaetota bacterium]